MKGEKSILSRILIIVALIFFLGCADTSSDSNTDSDDTDYTYLNMGIVLTSTLAPTYTWDGGNISTLSVKRSDNTSTQADWGIGKLNADNTWDTLVSSPTVHGEVPAGYIEFGDETVLTAGVEYNLTLMRIENGVSYIDYKSFIASN